MPAPLWTYQSENVVHPSIPNVWYNWVENTRVWASNVLRLHDEDGRPILILNKGNYKEWDLKASMVGGAAQILDNHQKELTSLGAKRFGDHHWWHPESFDVSGQKIHGIIERLSRKVTGIIEDGPDRESREELTQEIFPWRRDTPILHPSYTEWLVPIYSWLAIPIFSYWHHPRLKIVRVFDGQGLTDAAREKMRAADSVVFIPTPKELILWYMIRNNEKICISKLARWIYLKEMYDKVQVLH